MGNAKGIQFQINHDEGTTTITDPNHIEMVGKRVVVIPRRSPDLSALKNAEGLTALSLADTSVGDQDLGHLHRLRSLEELDLSGTNVTKAGLGQLLQHLPALHTLRLRGLRLEDDFLSVIPNPSSLLLLDLGGAKIPESELAKLDQLTDLLGLVLDGLPVTDEMVAATICKLPRLEGVELGRSKITDAGLQKLACIPKLRLVAVPHTRTTDRGFKSLLGIPTITTLDASFTGVTDRFLLDAAGHPQLEFLSLQGTQIRDEGIEHLKKIPHLKRLWLNSLYVSSAGLKNLGTLEILTELKLVLYERQGTVQDILNMKNRESLIKLTLVEWGLSDEELGQLRSAIPKCLIEAVKR